MTVLTEIRHAARRLLASRGYSASALLTLTLGLGLSVGMYTVLNGVLLASLPYPGGERVVEISTHNAGRGQSHSSLTAAEAFALADVQELERAGWYVWGGTTVLSGEQPREITINHVSAGFFPSLGVHPQLGRWIGPEDIGPERQAVVLSDAEWERLTNRNPDVLGEPLKLADEVVTVVGVMPPEFRFPADHVGLWRAVYPENHSKNATQFVNVRYVNAVGRIAAGADAAMTARGMNAMLAAVRGTHDLHDEGWRLQTTSLLDLAVGDVRGVLAGVFVVSLLVLAIACANVGSLLAARMAAREHELAIVQALGATSGRMWRMVLFELLLLAAAAIVAALLVLMAGLATFRQMSVGILPRADEIALEPIVLAFAAGLALVCPLIVAAPFGLRLRKRMAGNLQARGKGSAGATRGALRALPMTALALATTALIAGAAVAMSLGRLGAVEPGFRTADVYAIKVYHDGDAEEWRRFAAAVLARLRAQPDVEGAAVTTSPPLSLVSTFTVDVQVPGRSRPEPLLAGLRRVTPDYLEVLRQPLVRGRAFLPTDHDAAANVAIVNEVFARRVFPDLDPLGRDIALLLGDGPRASYRIVGVAADIRNAGLRSPADPEIIVPFNQSPWVGMAFLVHAPWADGGLLARMQDAIWAVDPEEAITRAYPLRAEVDAQLAQVTYFTRILGGFAVLAVLLAAFGTWSVIAFLQRRRTAEIGVRLALGAPPAGIAWRVLGQGLALAVFAGIAGSLAAIFVLRLLAAQLFGVGAASPGIYLLGMTGILLTGLLASAAPAWRASRVRPMEALRYE